MKNIPNQIIEAYTEYKAYYLMNANDFTLDTEKEEKGVDNNEK